MENENIIEQTIKGLLQKTIENKIPWKLVNPNAVRWIKTSAGTNITVTLQKQLHPVPSNSNYILTIQGPTPTTTNTQINSAIQPAYKVDLIKLFDAALQVGNSESIEVLKRLLDDL
ncbi:MAG: hypothetical protein Q8L81_12680 [Bacteroidota bacterium]|nr:hypothetical protein [Bacteroidota bacterium]